MSRVLAVVLIVVAMSATPASAFRGRVVDEDGRPVANAIVSVLGRAGEAVTDADGRFHWQPDPVPPFEILVIKASGVYMKPVAIQEMDPAAELLVTVAPILTEGIVVSGSAPSIEATPASGSTMLSGSEIAIRQPGNLVQALENVAGVSQVSEGQAAVPAVRGLARGRTLILIDGARVTAERRAGPSATYLDPAIIEGVDVSRGPGSVAYGSDAFGGVIAIRTRRVAAGSPWAFRVSGTAGAGVPERGASAEVSKGLPEGGVLVSAHTRKADDWDSPEGQVLNSGFSDSGFLARVEHRAGAGWLNAGWQSDFGRDIERPRDNSNVVRFYYPFEDSHRFTADYELHDTGGFKRLGISGFLGTYQQRTDQDRFATATTGRSIERADVAANDFHVRGFGERLLGRARLEVGLDVNGRFDLEAMDDLIRYGLDGSVQGTRPHVSIENAHRTDTGAYVSIDSAVAGPLSLGAGLRGDYVTTENTGGHFGDRASANGDYSGYLSLTAAMSGGFSVTGQVARGFRDPTLSDRYYRGPTGRGFVTGNPDLDPEASLQFDVAARHTAARVRTAAYFYRYRISDLIERYQAAPDFFHLRNSGAAVVSGFEVEGQADLGRGWSLDVAAQLVEGRAQDDDADLDDIPPANVSVVLRRQFSSRGFAQARVAAFAEDDHPGPTERSVPGYVLLDAAAGASIAKSLEVRINSRNLLNQTYFASQDTRAVLAPGRSVSVTLAIRF